MPQRSRPSPTPDHTPDQPCVSPLGGLRLSRRALFATTAAAIPAAAAVTLAPPAVADPTVTDGETRILDMPLADYELVDTDQGQARNLPGQPATMIGVTWPLESPAPAVHARGLTQDGEWTEWFELEIALDPETGDQAPGSELAWLGPVTALQIRATSKEGEPTAEMTAHIVTTSHTEADDLVGDYAGPYTSQSQTQEAQEAAQPQLMAAAATAAANPTTPTLAPQTPGFVTRAGWGANESWTRGTSGADQLKAVIIHHTAGTNNYAANQSAQIVRGILSYHAQTLGWADAGYNVFVDKYGQSFEGRGGGLHRNIVGAHARGFNTGSFGISVLGDYSSTAVPAAAREAVARWTGWKLLSTFNERAWGTKSWHVTTTNVRFAVGTTVNLAQVMGHRDVNFTECPGNRLYNEFDQIRGRAQYYIDNGWRVHLDAFNRGGGEAKLGTVVKSAHRAGKYWATVLTKGLVLSEGNGAATAYVSNVAKSWNASWGRPLTAPTPDRGRTIQAFEAGTAIVASSGRVTFETTVQFPDVPRGMMFHEEINELATRGITTGWPDGTYRPLAPIQRDAMVVFLYRALGSPAYTPPRRSPFSDMPSTRQHYKEVMWGYSEGIVEGWPDGTFRPTAPIERGAAAAFLYRASGRPSAGTSNSFTDVPSTHQFAREITWLASTGITTGWPDGTFRPVDPIARDAMAAFMIRWMEHRGI